MVLNRLPALCALSFLLAAALLPTNWGAFADEDSHVDSPETFIDTEESNSGSYIHGSGGFGAAAEGVHAEGKARPGKPILGVRTESVWDEETEPNDDRFAPGEEWAVPEEPEAYRAAFSREDLLQMRPRELKDLLKERGDDCADCKGMDKVDLVERTLLGLRRPAGKIEQAPTPPAVTPSPLSLPLCVPASLLVFVSLRVFCRREHGFFCGFFFSIWCL
jgi:hypothetical protein